MASPSKNQVTRISYAYATSIPWARRENDCHYLERKDARAHDCLMCISDREARQRHKPYEGMTV